MSEEMQRLAEEAANAEREGSRAAGGGAGSGSGSSGGSSGESTPGGGASGGTEEEGDSQGAAGGSGPGGTGSGRVPDDIGDGSDDDIVARQLREAAMTEEDPELREKLWEEYRRYKESVGGSTKGSK
jgi:hypothetical protein